MKIGLSVVLLAMMTCVPLTGCAATPQGLAKLRLHSMNASEYFQDPADVALVEAAGKGDTARMHKAIANGEDVNKVGRDGMTPLIWAVGVHPNLTGFKYLLDHGANPNTVTHLPARFDDDKAYVIKIAYEQSDPRFMKLLLQAGADPNTEVDGRDTLLSATSSDKRLEQIRLLVEHGANVNHRSKFNTTPLYDAVFGQQYRTALILLRSGADPKSKDTDGDTALEEIKSERQREKRVEAKLPGYTEFIQALKQKGYLRDDF